MDGDQKNETPGRFVLVMASVLAVLGLLLLAFAGG